MGGPAIRNRRPRAISVQLVLLAFLAVTAIIAVGSALIVTPFTPAASGYLRGSDDARPST